MTNLWYYYDHQGQSHLKVKVIPESNYKCLGFYPEVGSAPSTKCILVINGDCKLNSKYDNKGSFTYSESESEHQSDIANSYRFRFRFCYL